MKPLSYQNKSGETVYQLRVFDKSRHSKVATKTWKPDKKYTPKQLEKELIIQTDRFKQELKIANAKPNDPKNRLTFQEFSEKWMKEFVEPNLRATTAQGYKCYLKRINEGIGDIYIDELTPIQINQFLLNLREEGVNLNDKTMKSGLSSKSIKNFHSCISSAMSTATDWKLIESNPMDGVAAPKVSKTKVRSLDKESVEKLFAALENEPLKYNLFIRLAILSGMRRGEMMGLKWSCINFKNKTITISKTSLYTPSMGVFEDITKNEESNRIIKLSDSIFELLEVYKREQDNKKDKLGNQWVDNGYIFTQWNGIPMHPNTPYTWFVRFQKRNGLEHCSIHMLRHTTATLLIMNGINIKLVSGRLGHTNTSTTANTYADYIKEADEIVADALDNVLKL